MTIETTKGRALVLRTCSADMTSYGGFVWPTEGPVECSDWKPKTKCGNGLHGALWGEGDGSLLNWSPDAVWQVVEIEEWIDLNGKVKFPRGVVVHTGDQRSATEYIIANGARGAVIGAAVSAGEYGTATAGEYGTASAGYRGTASAGEYGTASAGYRGTASAGEYGVLQIKWFEGDRTRISTAYVGENWIKPNTPYCLNENGEFVEAQAEAERDRDAKRGGTEP
ncbi:hypothetical protein SAMN05444404_3176 [Ruegeria lacuscaerulensis ITI-1157]|nr:hypothetical protein SAMN05444404_3176 [Ruegeria lacuscaerulensis ITI-1157]